ncbi:MAG: type IX secretion system membrane protein PorP/SprF [Bacteroidota bacterium]
MRSLLSIILLFGSLLTFGQQQATFSQYMFNGLAINPAYAGSQDVLTATALARYQSLGLEGAPNTQTFAIHSPLLNENIGLGLLAVRDNISIINQYSISGVYAYRIKFTEWSNLAFGIQAGINSLDAQYSKARIQNPNDPVFQEDIRSFRPNFGLGVYYQEQKYFIGLSVPQLANNVFDRGTNLQTIKQDNPIILTGGYIFNLNRVIKFKPSALLKYVGNDFVEYNINAQLSFDDVLWVGASLKVLNAVDILTEVQLTRQLRLGYAYTHTINDLSVIDLGSHEMMVSYRFLFPPKEGLISPRYF